jgi:hypothetical protein
MSDRARGQCASLAVQNAPKNSVVGLPKGNYEHKR